MRTVPLTTFFQLLRERPLSWFGFAFTLLPLFLFLPVSLIMVSQAQSPYDRYDYERIVQHGQAETAIIDALEPVRNITVNGEHPLRIRYHYQANGTTQQDVFQTFDTNKIQGIEPGAALPIKYYEGQSVVTNLTSYRFPYFVFYLMPLIFIVIGLPFLLIGLLPALKKIKLYKHGVPQQAHLISMTPNTGLAARALGQHVLVNYYFTGPTGERIFDKATTPDFSILNHKKPDELIPILVSADGRSSCLVPQLENLKYNWGL